jgi:hypothetical protein
VHTNNSCEPSKFVGFEYSSTKPARNRVFVPPGRGNVRTLRPAVRKEATSSKKKEIVPAAPLAGEELEVWSSKDSIAFMCTVWAIGLHIYFNRHDQFVVFCLVALVTSFFFSLRTILLSLAICAGLYLSYIYYVQQK